MSQLANMILTDRTPVTPVNHTFVPKGIEGNVATLEKYTGVPIGAWTYSMSTRRTPSGAIKCLIKLVVPIVQTQIVNGVSTPVVVRRSIVEFSTTFESTSSEQERADAVGLMVSGLTASQLLTNDMLVKLQGVF